MGSGGREKGETKVHEQDKRIGVGMTTTTSGEGERERNTGGKQETEPTYARRY